MSRPLRLAGYITTGIVAGLLVASLAIWLLSRTEWGMERVRRFAVAWLAERVHGTIEVGPITGPGLLGGMTIHGFSIIDPKGRPFLSTDSLLLAYNWRTLLSGRVDLQRVVLYQPRAVLEILPGDTMWNYEIVFLDTTVAGPTRQRSLIRFSDTRVVNGTATVRLGLKPDEPISVFDTARAILERLPGGLARTMHFDNINAQLDRVIWESPLEKGRLFDIRSVAARGFVWRDPFVMRDAHGTLTLLDSIVSFDMPEVALAASRVSIIGQVIRTAGQNQLDIRVQGQNLQFRDLQFLHPDLPEEGTGSVDELRIVSQPGGGILWDAQNARIATAGSRVSGTLGVVTGDTTYFTRVNLRASPLDVKLLERLLPGRVPVDGLLVGTVEVRGPISALETSGDLQLQERAGTAGSHVAWSGVVDMRHGVARSLDADVKHLELSLLQAFNPQVRLKGSVSGQLHGTLTRESLSFAGLLEHTSSDGARATFDGGGTVSGSGRSRRLNVAVNASSVTLQDLATQIPALQGLQGELRGPVRLEGTSDDLSFHANIQTPGGTLDIEGRLQGTADARRITALAQATGFHLNALRQGLPETVGSGRVRFDITGSSLETARGRIQITLDSTRLNQLPNAHIAIGGSIDDGMFTVDSARWRSSFGAARAVGTLGLMRGRSGRLEVAFTSESLAPLEPYLFSHAQRDAAATPRFAGRGVGSATLTGWIGDFAVTANATAEQLIYGNIQAGTLRAGVTVPRVTDSRNFQLVAHADSLVIWSHSLPTAELTALGAADSITLSTRSAAGARELLTVRGTLRRDSALTFASARIDELRVGGAAPWLLAEPTIVRLHRGTAFTDRLELVRAVGGRAIAAGQLAWAGNNAARRYPVDFELDLSGVPFTELLRGLRSRQSGAGAVTGKLRITGTAADPVMEGVVEATGIQYGDVRMDRAYAELSYAARGLNTYAEAQHAGRSVLSGGGRIPLDLRLADVGERRLDEPLRFTLNASNLPPALPLALLDGFSRTAGKIDGAVEFRGTTLDPALHGALRIADGATLWDVSGVYYTGVNGAFTLEGDRVVHIDLNARAEDTRRRVVRTLEGDRGGTGTIRGTLDLTELTNPRFGLRLAADRVYAARRRDVEATVSGELQLSGAYRRPILSGALRVEQGALYLDEIYRQYLLGGLQLDDRDPSLISLVDTSLVAVRPLLSTSRNPFLRGLLVRNMDVVVDSDSWLRSRDMDVEVRGDLNVAFDMLREDLRLTGSLNVERGTYTLYYPPLQSRRFQVRQGSIDFLGTPGIDPNLSITAAYKARAQGEPLDVLAIVSGTMQSPRVRLSSDAQPPISESDLASYLFFGVPTWQVASTTGTPGEVRAVAGSLLGPTVLGYASSGLQALGQNSGLVDYVSITAAEVAPENQATNGVANLLAGTQLEVGRYIWSRHNIFVGYTQRFSSGVDPAARLEWRFRPEYSFELFAEDRLARTPGFGVRPETGLKRVYGFLLFREWAF